MSASQPKYAQPGGAASSPDKFLSDENRRMLYGVLSKDMIKRGITLTPKMAEQLDMYLNHYVDEVHSVQGNKPLTFLNKEVLVVTAQEFTASLKKPAVQAPAVATAATAKAQGPVVAARALGKPPSDMPGPAGADMSDALFMDTGSRFDALQKERMEGKKAPPPMPEFKIDFSDDGPSPLELYERAKKAREESMLLATPPPSKPLDVLVPAETRPPRVTVADTLNEFTDALTAREKGIAVASPNLVTIQDTDKKILSQQVVIKDDDVVSYKEVENNLFVYSVDRDWYNNSTDNRYNFSVNFDPANNKQGFGLNPAANIKFKNIVRIEFVKVIIPAEGLDVLISQDAISPSIVYSTNVNINALTFPFLTLRISEFDGNNYGTDNNLDNSFAVLQYDANWSADSTNNAANRGFFAFIPKSLKAQRIWAPTPLATLARLSLRLERPDGTLLQSSLDTNSVADVIGSQEAAVNGTTFFTGAGAARYLFIKTSQYFSQFAVQKGDRILFQQFTATNATYPDSAVQMNTYMNSTGGLLVVGIANDTVTPGTVLSGANIVGYANYIIVEAEMEDPTTGSTSVDFFGPDAATHNNFLAGSTTYAGKMINLNRQTQFVFRVITRELDPMSRLRPDNLN